MRPNIQQLPLVLAVLTILWTGIPGTGHAQPASPEAAASARIDSVIVAGVEDSLRAELAAVLISIEGTVYNEGLVAYDLRQITGHLAEHGWWYARAEATVDSTTGAGIHLRYDVAPGEPMLFGGVRTTVPTTASGVGEEVFASVRGRRFERTELERLTGAVISSFAADGYPDVAVAPHLEARGDTIDVILDVTPGRRAVIEGIRIGGLTRTRDSVIRRELAGITGKPAGSAVRREARSILDGLPYVRLSEEPAIAYDDSGRAHLLLALGEGSQGSFDGVLGYQPSPAGGSGDLIGMLDISLFNLMGTGRSASLRWEDMGDRTEDLAIAYREPWLMGHPYNVTTSFTQEERERRGYIRTLFTAGVDRNFADVTLNAGYRYEKVSADSVHSSRADGFEAGIGWSTVTNRLNPASGHHYHASWSLVSKRFRFGDTDDNRVTRLELDFDHFVPVRGRQVLALLLRYRHLQAPDASLSPSDRYWLGGSTTIRGYREHILPAVKAGWVTLEYRFLTGERSRVFLFGDAAYLVNREERDGTPSNVTRDAAGYGFGLRLESAAGVLGFDYGLARGDSPGDGKLHVRLSAAF